MQRLLEFPRAARFQAWSRFHRQNPAIWYYFVRFSNDARLRGRKRFSARIIGERIRWHVQVEIQQTDGTDYKLNDHYWPYYARLLMRLRPDEFWGFFERRDARFDATDDEIAKAHKQAEAVWKDNQRKR